MQHTLLALLQPFTELRLRDKLATTYTLISSNTLSASAASVTFSSIPSTYTDLCLKISARTDDALLGVHIRMTIDNNASTNYAGTRLYGTGAAAFSARYSTGSNTYWLAYDAAEGTSATTSTFTNSEIYLPNYAVSGNKIASMFDVTETNAANTNMDLVASLFTGTTTISSFILTSNSGGNFVSGSSFYLYGIKNS